jgi:glycosidase
MSHATPPATQEHLPWTRSANIYEVNLRQYTPEGTLRAFMAHLPRLRKMGVDILWLMPIQPIGLKNRKGTLGSCYAIRDYTAVNPEFGTLDDARALVREAHAMGFKVILDWVANHTAWDHPWTTAHTDWYKLDEQGRIFPVTFNAGTPQVEHWTDVVALNYDSAALRRAMIDAMAFWVREAEVDGFRCDVAGLMPTVFWDQARAELDAIKPMFMLAEWSEPELHERAFDMTYGWDLAAVLKRVAKGEADARALAEWVKQPATGTSGRPFPRSAYRMRFTSNHDENAWHGHDAETYGPAFKAVAVLAATLPGMPLIYGGQEAGLHKRLAFFEKDPIDWQHVELAGFYADLLALKKANTALWNGRYGGDVDLLDMGSDGVFAFRRQAAGNVVTVMVNVSPREQRLRGPDGTGIGALAPWGWKISTT